MSATTNEKLGETSCEVPTSEISCDSLSAIRSLEFHVVRPPCWSVGRSLGPRETSRRRKLFARRVLGFFIGNYLFPHPSPSIRMAEIKRQINVSRADGPNVRTENPILACRAARLVRVSSLLLIVSSLPSIVLSFDPSTSRPTLSSLSLHQHLPFIFSFTPPALSLPSHPPSPHTHIHRNWSLTTAKHYHIPIKITSSLLQILFPFPSSSAIFPFPLPRDTSRFSSRKWTFPHILFRQVEKDCAKFRDDSSCCCILYKIYLK